MSFGLSIDAPAYRHQNRQAVFQVYIDSRACVRRLLQGNRTQNVFRVRGFP